MIPNKYAVVCNPVVEKDGEETMGPLITINPAAVAMAEPCVWKNSSATNEGTLLHFVNPNIPARKIAADLDLWQRWAHEALR